MTSRNRTTISSSSNTKKHGTRNSLATKQTPTIKKSVIRHRKIELNAIVDAAESTMNDKESEEDDDDGDAETETEEEEEEETRPVYDNNESTKKTARQSSLSDAVRRQRQRRVLQASYDDDYLAPGESYAFLWNLPSVRFYLRWMAFTAVILLWLNFFVFLMWFFGAIPGLPSSTMYYGFIFYFLFITVGGLSLIASCSMEKSTYTVSIILTAIAFILALILEWLIYLTIVDCYNGLLDSSCGNFYPFQGLLFLLTGAIAIALLVLLFFFAIMMVRIGQSSSTVDSFY
jgi:hypothetical protein